MECVDFDTELGEYGTTGGIFTTPGEAYTTPVEMWIKALDTLLLKLSLSYPLAHIKSISGCAQHALVFWKGTSPSASHLTHSPSSYTSSGYGSHSPSSPYNSSPEALPSLSSLDPHLALHTHFPSRSFSLPNTPTALDSSAYTHALAIESLLGGPEEMVRRVGVSAQVGGGSLVGAGLLRVREGSDPSNTAGVTSVSSKQVTGGIGPSGNPIPVGGDGVWAKTAKIQLASNFLASLISGKWIPMGEAEACGTGMWVHDPSISQSPHSQTQSGHWDDAVLDIIGGSREEGRRLRGLLGEVDTSGLGGGQAGVRVSRYLVERYVE